MKHNAAIVTFNAGSSNLKFGLYANKAISLECIIQGGIIQGGIIQGGIIQGGIINLGSLPVFEISHQNENQHQTAHSLPQIKNHAQAITWLLDWFDNNYPDIHISAAEHRVVHGGSDFTHAVKTTPQVLQQLFKLVHLAPLHMPHNLAIIEALQKEYPTLTQVACFDTAFHHTMSWNEKHYALPHEWFDKGVRHYGFHGLSYEYIASVLTDYLGEWADARVIVAHLGHGASLCAMRAGQSVATTMGFTPIGGIPMATRADDIDPGRSNWIMRNAGLSADEVDNMLNHPSGLPTLFGISGDMRVLLADPRAAAQRAIDYFTHHTRRAIDSLTAALGDLDALIFTAGIGENSAAVRQQICTQASWLGLVLDKSANASNNIRISTQSSSVSVWRIPTNEEIMIAHHTQTLLTDSEPGESR